MILNLRFAIWHFSLACHLIWDLSYEPFLVQCLNSTVGGLFFAEMYWEMECNCVWIAILYFV